MEAIEVDDLAQEIVNLAAIIPTNFYRSASLRESLLLARAAIERGEKIERLEALLAASCEETRQNFSALMQASDRLIAMKKALEFYADAATYQANGHQQIDADLTPINKDRGRLAREALGLEG